ncbi:CBS domain-containing protein [Leptolyngbya sp. FACHB-36]|uniref:CBS domain-containing protein n=1 Tax=Leptolyngbya sp. FACHB-36 TaxID=2692808 RepID=UPI001681182D|nr:CBS domain-containing protein [Leptolyngbya sp. FACHB-36]MBD2020659.1 CBS domain-containing protein [Leptolyngbya sp. FACHB-36]
MSPHSLSFYSIVLETTIDRRPLTVTPETLLSDVLVLMSQVRSSCTLPIASDPLDICSLGESPASCALVVEGARLIGMFTEQDVVRLTADRGDLRGIAIAAVMAQPVVTLTQSNAHDILTALSLFRQHQIRHLPVVDEHGHLIGLITPESIRQVLQPANLLRLRTIDDVMEADVVQAPLSESVLTVAQRMAAERVSCAVLTNSVQPTQAVGILTERDIVQLQALELPLGDLRAEVAMSTPLFCLQRSDSLWVAHQEMQCRHVRRFVVTGEQGELLGVVTQLNMLRALDPVELFNVVNMLQQTVNRLEAENIALLQTRNSELEQQVQDRTAQLQALYEQAQAEIRDRKRVEAERTQLLVREQAARQEAQTANRLKDEFLSILSHEIRTPLNAMLGWAHMLRTRTFDAATMTHALETIERNAKAQAQLIDDLLDVSRIIRGQLRLDLHPMSLRTVVVAAIETLQPAINAKKIHLKTSLETSIDRFLGDPSRLQQVVWNLLSNAVKFTPAEGQIEVRLSEVGGEKAYSLTPDSYSLEEFANGGTSHVHAERFTLPYAPQFIQLTITDTGEGIDADFLPHIFERFRQADSKTTRRHSGLGLGLAIVRHLVELHGGTVDAASSGVGRGATFTVKLPLRTTSTTSDTYKPNAPDQSLLTCPLELNGVRVLVVDDEADSCEVTTAILSACGAEVMGVTSAEAALVAFTEFKPDILVSDIGMPDTDGYSLIRQLRSTADNPIPAVALTAYAREDDRRQSLLAGFQTHLAKPVTPAELVGAVGRLTRGVGVA